MVRDATRECAALVMEAVPIVMDDIGAEVRKRHGVELRTLGNILEPWQPLERQIIERRK